MAGSTPASATAKPGGSSGPAGAGPTPLGKPITSVSPWTEAWRRFKRHRLAFWSLWLLGLLVLAVLLGPVFYKVGINASTGAPPSVTSMTETINETSITVIAKANTSVPNGSPIP